MDLLKKYNINPYKFLGIDKSSDIDAIKKAYKQKAKILHPDKTNGKTEAQFKILNVCYKLAKANCIIIEEKEIPETREEQDEKIHIDTSYHYNDERFLDREFRKNFFVDDEIDFESFKEKLKRVENISTEYVAENFYKKEILEKFKTKGVFDQEKFNAYFVKLKENKNMQIAKVEEVKPYNSDEKYSKVNVHDGIMITRSGKQNFNKTKKISQEDMEKLLNTESKVIEKIMKENSRDTKKIPIKVFKQMQQKKALPIAINQNKDMRNFDELQKEMQRDFMLKLQEEREENKVIVEKYKDILFTRYLE